MWASVVPAIALLFQQAAPPFDPVFIRTPLGVKGNGARFLIGDRCVTITAWHVVEGSSVPQIVPMRSRADQGTVETRAEKLDVGLVVQGGGAARSCARMPTAEQIDRALLGGTREVWQVTESGEAVPFRVSLVRYNGTTLKLEIAPGSHDPDAPKAFTPGMSGALVVFDGVPVAILQSTAAEQPIADAIRIDFVARQFPATFATAAPATAVATRRAYKPYDEAQLPPEYRELVKAARNTKARAIAAAAAADRTRRDAEDAAALAKVVEKNVPYKGRAHYDADNGNYYAGEVYQVGNDLRSAGFGVAEVMKGDAVGNRFFCRFVRDTGCAGMGVVEYADNKSRSDKVSRWRGGLDGNKWVGLGILDWRGSTDHAWLSLEDERINPGVWLTDDGRLFEGEAAFTWNGRGVLWNAEGKVIQIGRWKAGALEVNENSKLATVK